MFSTANDTQVGGDHYKQEGKQEHWDFVAQHNLDYFQGQITKYIIRWKKKGGVKDLEKALHFTQKYIELVRAGTIPDPTIKPTHARHPYEIADQLESAGAPPLQRACHPDHGLGGPGQSSDRGYLSR